MMTGKYEESPRGYAELERLFSQHSDLWQEEPMDYAYLVDGILTGLHSQRHEAMQQFITKLNYLGKQSPAQHAPISQLAFGHQLDMLADAGEFGKGLVKLDKYRTVPHPEVSSATHGQTWLYFNVARMEQYHTALKYVNDVLNNQASAS